LAQSARLDPSRKLNGSTFSTAGRSFQLAAASGAQATWIWALRLAATVATAGKACSWDAIPPGIRNSTRMAVAGT
jgi:hypothetical protein